MGGARATESSGASEIHGGNAVTEKRSWAFVVQRKAQHEAMSTTGHFNDENVDNSSSDHGNSRRGRGRRERGERGDSRKRGAGGKSRHQHHPEHALERTEGDLASLSLSSPDDISDASTYSGGRRSSASSQQSPFGSPPSHEALATPHTRIPTPSMPAPAERQLSAHEALVSASGLARLREALVEDFLVLPREGALPGGGAQDWGGLSSPPLRVCPAQLLAHVQGGLEARACGRRVALEVYGGVARAIVEADLAGAGGALPRSPPPTDLDARFVIGDAVDFEACRAEVERFLLLKLWEQRAPAGRAGAEADAALVRRAYFQKQVIVGGAFSLLSIGDPATGKNIDMEFCPRAGAARSFFDDASAFVVRLPAPLYCLDPDNSWRLSFMPARLSLIAGSLPPGSREGAAAAAAAQWAPLPRAVVAACLARPFAEAARLVSGRLLVIQDPAAVVNGLSLYAHAITHKRLSPATPGDAAHYARALVGAFLVQAGAARARCEDPLRFVRAFGRSHYAATPLAGLGMTAQLLMVLYAHAPGWGDGERGGAGEAAPAQDKKGPENAGAGGEADEGGARGAPETPLRRRERGTDVGAIASAVDAELCSPAVMRALRDGDAWGEGAGQSSPWRGKGSGPGLGADHGGAVPVADGHGASGADKDAAADAAAAAKTLEALADPLAELLAEGAMRAVDWAGPSREHFEQVLRIGEFLTLAPRQQEQQPALDATCHASGHSVLASPVEDESASNRDQQVKGSMARCEAGPRLMLPVHCCPRAAAALRAVRSRAAEILRAERGGAGGLRAWNCQVLANVLEEVACSVERQEEEK